MFNTAQTTTGNYNFAPSGAEFALTAFGRCQVRPAELSARHMFDVRMALNFILSEWSNYTPNLWEVQLQAIPLTQGQAVYAIPQPVIMILDMYVNFGGVDHYLWPISRTEYASYAVKTTQAPPNVYWYDRLVSEDVTFYPVPDGNGPYIANAYVVKQSQDSDLQNGVNTDVPYRFFEAYTAGVAWKLAEIYQPALEDKLFNRYTRALAIAQKQDVENTPLTISPQFSAYYR
jgi:hypothetical protein